MSVKAVDYATAAAAGVALLLVFAILRFMLGDWGWVIALPLSTAAVLILLLEVYRRSKTVIIQEGRQSEALASLIRVLPLRTPLPPMGEWAVSPDFARILVWVLQETRPRLVLELGSGASTVITGYVLSEAGIGCLISLDHEADYSEQTRHQLVLHDLQDLVTVVTAPLEPVKVNGHRSRWYGAHATEDVGPIDLLVVDGPPSVDRWSRYPALPILMEKLSDSATVVVDDYKRDRDYVASWLRDYPEFQLEEFDTEKGTAVLRRLLA
jgi:predicted O-methyltransferase YrrM